ncbi:YajG family lipoprotein [Azomonas macrocytogenes]|uniref:Putative lipoprotein n=1 Tax=Azomonas macrocytogenes TaxID=69962 RepID=A0A839T624_AZOMA|nr:YajG family lipoprotein [Azomonas macrocytogenes]MBB3104951.1 putative lipoprotein [Azomonas macrocytogenes]
MLQRLLFGLALIACVGLTGCANSPQQLDPIPKLNDPITAVGQGQPVIVRVVDGRPSSTLGTRGGIYPDTSLVIVPSDKLLPKLQAQVETAVRLLGFTPSPNAANAPQLTVTLAELKYQSPNDDIYVTDAVINATFRLDVQNATRRYTGRYSASLNRRFGMTPSEQTNNELVGSVLSDALTRVFKDQNIAPLLVQQ